MLSSQLLHDYYKYEFISLYLPGQDLHKSKPSIISGGIEEKLRRPYS